MTAEAAERSAPRGARPSARFRWAALATALALGALYTEPAPAQPVELVQAASEIGDDLRLDVGIEIFDPGFSDDEDGDALVERGIFPELRRSEARFIPLHLKTTLESTGHWGAVRVVPSDAEGVDLVLGGEILESTGRTLVVRVQARDATGRVWRDRKYKQEADILAYRDDALEPRDPYQSLYNRVANDLLATRERLEDEQVRRIREISRLQFAADLAPAAFGDYLASNRKGRVVIERLPAEDDPMLDRVARIRARDHRFVDTLNEHYADFYRRMGDPYDDWRKFSYEEQVALRKIRREARMKKILGGLLIVGAGVAGGSGTAARAGRSAAAVGGAITLQEGLQKGKQGKIHVEALKELAASFDAEVEPLLVEVEGRVLRLEGSAEAQYAEWRRLLSDIFASETGLNTPGDVEGRPLPAGAADR